jgi:hypothetical protein
VVEQLEDISRILLAFYLLSLEDFGDFSQIMYFIFDIIHKGVLPCEESYKYL